MDTFGHNLKLWIFNKSQEGVFGDGKYRLLLAIEEFGSLREASKKLAISYRKAWGDIKKAEKCLGFELVAKMRGGAGGGASQLTDHGKLLVEKYRVFRDCSMRDVDRNFKRFLKEVSLLRKD